MDRWIDRYIQRNSRKVHWEMSSLLLVTIYTIYLSLCTQTAMTTSPEPFLWIPLYKIINFMYIQLKKSIPSLILRSNHFSFHICMFKIKANFKSFSRKDLTHYWQVYKKVTTNTIFKLWETKRSSNKICFLKNCLTFFFFFFVKHCCISLCMYTI